jgi:hypothetical protein
MLGDHPGNCELARLTHCRYCHAVHNNLAVLKDECDTCHKKRDPMEYQDVVDTITLMTYLGRGFQGAAEDLRQKYGVNGQLVSVIYIIHILKLFFCIYSLLFGPWFLPDAIFLIVGISVHYMAACWVW